MLVNIPFRYEPPLPPAVPDGIRLEGADGHWRPYQSYLHEMVKSVSIEWTRAVREGGGAISASGNSIEVNFIVDKNGKVARILSFHPSRGTSKAAIDVCLAGIRNGAPYGDWTEEMVAALGPSQELTFAFDYQ